MIEVFAWLIFVAFIGASLGLLALFLFWRAAVLVELLKRRGGDDPWGD